MKARQKSCRIEIAVGVDEEREGGWTEEEDEVGEDEEGVDGSHCSSSRLVRCICLKLQVLEEKQGGGWAHTCQSQSCSRREADTGQMGRTIMLLCAFSYSLPAVCGSSFTQLDAVQ